MTSTATRPHWTALDVVEAGNLLLRLLRRGCFIAAAPRGTRVQPAACHSRDYEPSDDSYGASAFVNERLENGAEDLYAANAKWREYILVRVPVQELLELEGLQVRYSPQDIDYDSLKHAHASIIGMTPALRNEFIRLLDRFID